MRAFAALALLALLSACTVPLLVIGKDGQILKGTATGSYGRASFNFTDGHFSCGGSSHSWNPSKPITMPVLCSDGRKGILVATPDPSSASGRGTVILDDGSEWTFTWR